MKIIINADDFGISHEVNSAIVEAFEKGYITNTTVMTNMPGYDEAISLAKEHGFFEKVGIHLNFFAGSPLTEDMKKDGLFVEDGKMTSYNMFHKESKLRYLFLPKHTRRALESEAAAQFEKYREAGFSEFHLDSHGHAHTIPSVYRAIKKTVKRFGFKSVRISLNLFSHRPLFIRIYKRLLNKWLSAGMKTTVYFTSADEFAKKAQQGLLKDATYEIMVHPVYENGKLKNGGSLDFETLFEYINEKDLASFVEI